MANEYRSQYPNEDNIKNKILNVGNDELKNKVFVGIVTECKEDGKFDQYIRVKILNVLDDVPMKFQPWCRRGDSISANSTKPAAGTYVDVTFSDGDIHLGTWKNARHAARASEITGDEAHKQKIIFDSQNGASVSYDKHGNYTIRNPDGNTVTMKTNGVVETETNFYGVPIPTARPASEYTVCPTTCSLHKSCTLENQAPVSLFQNTADTVEKAAGIAG